LREGCPTLPPLQPPIKRAFSASHPCGPFPPATPSPISLRAAHADKAAPDALVTGYEHLIPGLMLPDEKDRHVLAAAIRSGASVIVTCNLADFPRESLREFGVEAQHPDEFILNLLDLAPGLVIEAAENHRQSLKNPPKTVEEYLTMLESQGLTQTTSVLREYIRGLN
jgi:hypothetical protein